ARSSRPALGAAIVGVLLLAACAPSGAPKPSSGPPTSLPPTLPTAPPTSKPPTTRPPVTPPPPTFTGTVTVLPADLRATMTGRSWRPGCPVGLDDLRLLTMSYWGFDNVAHIGRMVLHRSEANAVLGVFHFLFAVRFPIQRMQLVDDFGADDNASMAANNTSAFNCRAVDGSPGVWSQHSYGWAVDINPVQNPWVRGSIVQPAAGLAYLDRSKQAPGMIHA